MNEIFQIFSTLHAQVFDSARLPVAVCALLIVSIVGVLTGPLGGNANPVLWRAVDFMFGPVGSKLGNTQRTRGDLMTRGLIVCLMGLIISFLAGSFFSSLSTHYPTYKIVDIVALSLCLTSGAGWYCLFRLYSAVKGDKKIKGAFYALAVTSRNNLTAADEYTITRVGIGMAARLFDKGVVAPVLWYLIGGLPVVFVYTALAALSWRFGKEGFSKGFGDVALALEKLMGFIPNVFAGIMVALAGLLTPTAGMTRSFIGLLRLKSGNASYFEGGAPVTAMAWALKVSLGGATQDMDGSAIKRGWAGPAGATAQLEAKHLHRAIYIIIMAHLLFLATLMVGILIDGYGFLS